MNYIKKIENAYPIYIHTSTLGNMDSEQLKKLENQLKDIKERRLPDGAIAPPPPINKEEIMEAMSDKKINDFSTQKE